MPHYTDDFPTEPPPPRCANHPDRDAVRVTGLPVCLACYLRTELPPERMYEALMTYYARESAVQCRLLMGVRDAR